MWVKVTSNTAWHCFYVTIVIMFGCLFWQAAISSFKARFILWHYLITRDFTFIPPQLFTPNFNGHLNLDSSCGFLFELLSASEFFAFFFFFLTSLSWTIMAPWQMNCLGKLGARTKRRGLLLVWRGGGVSKACTIFGLTFRQFSTACLRWWSGSTFAFRAWNYTHSNALFKYYLWIPLT